MKRQKRESPVFLLIKWLSGKEGSHKLSMCEVHLATNKNINLCGDSVSWIEAGNNFLWSGKVIGQYGKLFLFFHIR